ncbi:MULTISPECIES: PLP-dependent aminotransferase family protein [Bacillus amyloliquefaciens group]|uniref:aminotransferase-like domain-containing protein n=1 Tax=Bacillus amyloliquefaciens group TaxID=1938374 RepID=UPI00024164C5|nr:MULTISPECIES: PLP-dependent aminotransferase family protein [Bacillus amyloliquefaciens group]AGF25543.1 Crp/Fnr family transcriptional regulator [Bacillus amyloliquefaciens IT-45]AMP33956.1 GntR family transcriptional regulator [Bacillus amyloliquefaciens]ERK85054.1 GntR family transcriptional regulator [Bacillus amyloliquefaciens UASWS BA1]MBH5312483.1 PLP-dependent aminotransferase family protein [Bacillus velezensis]MDQ1916718.1 PLP-dependent aminotransferase family protein [Bacillus ve
MSAPEEKKMRKLPKYIQIIQFIKEKIGNGEWPIGSKIPSQRTLAKHFEVNRSTVITALEELTADGLIEGRMGKGTVVTNNTWTLLAKNSSPDWDQYVTSGIQQPSQKIVQEINKSESNSDLIQLSKGELSHEIFPLAVMKEIMGKVSQNIEAFGYEEPKGYLPLREALSGYLRTIGIQASPSSILIVSGALQALQLISMGLLQRGSTVYLDQPSYLYSLHVFQSAGMKLTGVPMDHDGLLPEHIRMARGERGRAILYTNPCFQNPTGILMSKKRREEILAASENTQLPIIEDDIYRELWIDEIPPDPIKTIDKNGHVLYIGSLSKTLSPGLRIGWIVGPEPVIERLSDIKMQTDYGSSSLSQRVAAEWFISGEYQQHLEQVRSQLKVRRELALSVLETHLKDVATWNIPKGGFFVWVKTLPSISMKLLYTKALSKGILLNLGRIYAQEKGNYIRLSYAYASLEDLQKGIYELGLMIKELASR